MVVNPYLLSTPFEKISVHDSISFLLKKVTYFHPNRQENPLF